MPMWGMGSVASKLRGLLGFVFVSWAMLATTFPSPALGQNYPVEAVAPTAQEIQDWGFTVEEFQGLVQRMFDLLKKQYQLSQELGTPWITKMDDAALRREAVGNVEHELSLRRRYSSTPPERFRQGMHQRALEGAAKELFSGLERDIAGMQQKLDTLQANRTRIRQRVPQSEVYEPSPHDTRVRGVTPEGSNPENMEVVELNRLGNVPAEEQAARFQAQTVRETPPDVREPVQPNPNYQGPPAMDDPNMRGTVKPLV